MNFNDYLQTVLLRARPMDGPRQMEHAQIGMLTELGELGDLIKKEFAYGKEFDRVNLMEECGDFLWYLVLYAHESGIGTTFFDGVLSKCLESPKYVIETDSTMLRMLGQATGMLSAPTEVMSLDKPTHEAFVEATFMIIVAFLLKYGFTVEQCLVANDAKLETRTGKVFDAGRVINRDVAAERAILEDRASRN
jgi:hypothetical protein